MDLMQMMEDAPMTAKNSFEPLPAGQYLATVTNATVSQKDDGLKYEVEFVVTEGEHKNRKLWYSQTFKATHSPERGGIIKRQLLNMVGMEDLNGKTLPEWLQILNGSCVKVYLSYRPNANKPDKPWQDIEAEPASETIPF